MRLRISAVIASLVLGSSIVATLGVTSASSTGAVARYCLGQRATIVGTRGDDIIRGTSRGDVIVAGPGNDVVHGGGGRDQICGGDGADVLYGDVHPDLLQGGRGPDRVYGGEGHDILYDGPRGYVSDGGRDLIAGGPDPDRLYATGGIDRVVGGTGYDSAMIRGGDTALMGPGRDRVYVRLSQLPARVDGGDGVNTLFLHGDGQDPQPATLDLQAGTLDSAGSTIPVVGFSIVAAADSLLSLWGTDGPDILCVGSNGTFDVQARGGDDVLSYQQSLFTEDTVYGPGSAQLDGGDGNDSARYFSGSSTTLVSIENSTETDEQDGPCF